MTGPVQDPVPILVTGRAVHGRGVITSTRRCRRIFPARPPPRGTICARRSRGHRVPVRFHGGGRWSSGTPFLVLVVVDVDSSPTGSSWKIVGDSGRVGRGSGRPPGLSTRFGAWRPVRRRCRRARLV